MYLKLVFFLHLPKFNSIIKRSEMLCRELVLPSGINPQSLWLTCLCSVYTLRPPHTHTFFVSFFCHLLIFLPTIPLLCTLKSHSNRTWLCTCTFFIFAMYSYTVSPAIYKAAYVLTAHYYTHTHTLCSPLRDTKV